VLAGTDSQPITPWRRENKTQNGADKARAVEVDDFPVARDELSLNLGDDD
jgi:hypothetical protein